MTNYGTEGREFESLRARCESPAQAGFCFSHEVGAGGVATHVLPNVASEMPGCEATRRSETAGIEAGVR
jgi:hypothetical protein